MSASGAHSRCLRLQGELALCVLVALGASGGCNGGVEETPVLPGEADAAEPVRPRRPPARDAGSFSGRAGGARGLARDAAIDAGTRTAHAAARDSGTVAKGRDEDASPASRTRPRDAGRPRERDADAHVGHSASSVDARAPRARPDASLGQAPEAGSGLPDAAARLDGDARAPSTLRVAETHALDDYVLIGPPRVLPELDDNASDIAWRPETDTFFVVENGGAALHEYNRAFSARLRVVLLTDGPTDTEGLAYLGAGRFAVSVEEGEVYVFTLADDALSVNLSSQLVARYVVSEPPRTINRGFEGVAYQADGARFFVAEEGGDPEVPKRILAFDERSDGTRFDFEEDLVVSEPFDAEQAFDERVSDLSGLHFDAAASNLLVLSDESRRLLRVVPETGSVLEERLFTTSTQYEGVTLADQHRLVLVSEPNTVELYRAE